VANPESSLTIAIVVMNGSEHLASDKIVMRLGGIYALEGVMNTSEQYHGPVLEALWRATGAARGGRAYRPSIGWPLI
jgi:hypothetical protein